MAPPQIGLSILRVGIFPVANAEIVRRRRHHQIDAFVRQSRHSFDAIFSAKIEPGHGEKCRAIMRVVQALNHTRPFSGEHRAASLLSSAACRRLPRLARIWRDYVLCTSRKRPAYSISEEHRLPACTFRQPAEKLFERSMTEVFSTRGKVVGKLPTTTG